MRKELDDGWCNLADSVKSIKFFVAKNNNDCKKCHNTNFKGAVLRILQKAKKGT